MLIAPEIDPLGPFKTLNAMLEENPPPALGTWCCGQFDLIGIRPGLDVDAQPEAVKQGLIRAEVLGMAMLKQQFLSGDWATIVNGWRYAAGDRTLRRRLPAARGRPIAGGDRRQRPGRGRVLVTFTDADGKTFDADGRYELHFEA